MMMRNARKEPFAHVSSSSSASNNSNEANKQSAPAFLEKLFDILDDNSPYSHLISWQPDGASFIIKKVHEFSETVLPKYFKHSNIQSYIRQLNMYGFSKTRHDSNHREFTHKMFRKGRRDLLPLIKRKSQQNLPVPTNASAPSPTPAAPAAIPSIAPSHFDSNQTLLDYDVLKVSESLQYLQDSESRVNYDSSNSAGSSNSHPHQSSSQQRVSFLEQQVQLLSQLYFNLASKHNLLCDTLQMLQEADGGASSTSGVDEGEGEEDAEERREEEAAVATHVVENTSHDSNASNTSNTSNTGEAASGAAAAGELQQLLRRMTSISDYYDSPAPPAAASSLAAPAAGDAADSARTRAAGAEGGAALKRSSSACQTDAAAAGNSSKRARSNSASAHPGGLVNYQHFKTADGELQTLLHGNASNSSGTGSSSGLRVDAAALRRSKSVEMRGLDMITKAACWLDNTLPASPAQQEEDVYGGLLLQRGAGASGQVKKAYSYGPERSRRK
eukprot:gene24915-30101_t